jgi:hypothetical protein
MLALQRAPLRHPDARALTTSNAMTRAVFVVGTGGVFGAAVIWPKEKVRLHLFPQEPQEPFQGLGMRDAGIDGRGGDALVAARENLLITRPA